jgi:general secretion pathway protein D
MTIASMLPIRAPAQDTSAVRAFGDSIAVRFVDADLRGVIQALGRYLSKPVLVGTIPGTRVSLETPAPVSRTIVGVLLRGLVESQGLELVEDTAFVRIGPKTTQAPPAALPVTAGRPAGAVQLFVVRLKHARAADIAATVNLLFGAGGEFSGRAGVTSGTLSDELRRNTAAAGAWGAQSVPPQTGGRPDAGQSAALGGQVTIVPDQLTNSLLIRAAQEDYDVLAQAVAQLDIRPLQVLIEVLIVEARKDRNFSLGADVLVPKQNIGGDGTIEGDLQGGGLGDLIIRLMNLGKPDVDAVLRTAQSRGDAEIVSRPVLLASNNTEARFLVGSQRPFVQVSRSLPTDTPSRDQVIQYQAVGTKLTVRPTINQDGYVTLAIQQEISAATGETQFDAPVISTREAATQVLVRDGQTIVLGGLRDRQRDRSRSGVPVLSGLPLVGGFFGESRRRSTETELYLFLTPRILRTDAEVDSVTAPRMPKIAP